ncbi:MAG: hypothetical protein QOG60_1338 [Frankiaceae bacterium]|jgi:hypothetical protein|nr:hypothetical protein [Frankiaceae bacterium]
MSGIETAARVAALRERAARARYGASGKALLAAEQTVEAQHRRVADAGVPDGGTPDLADWHAVASRRAAAARDAEGAVTAAGQARQEALIAWQDTSRRREALDEVVGRWRAARRVQADKDAQRLMDDLGRRKRDRA